MDSKSLPSKFADTLRKIYKDNQFKKEEQWSSLRGDIFINLEIVQANKPDGFVGNSQKKIRHQIRTPILKKDLLSIKEKGQTEVKKVVIEGNAGMGKTTLCTMLFDEWANGEVFKTFSWLLFLPLREEEISRASELLDIINFYYHDKELSQSARDELLQSGGEGLLIVADGWDELKECYRRKDSFLYQLFFTGRHPVSSASLILTSRPSASAALHEFKCVHRFVEVLGFNKLNIQEFFEAEVEDDAKRTSILRQLDSSLFMANACSVPLVCAIICDLLKSLDIRLPDTYTELYTLIVLRIIYRDIKNKYYSESEIFDFLNFDCIPDILNLKERFWQVCRFAFECLLKDEFVFSVSLLNSFFPEHVHHDSDSLFCFGLLQFSHTKFGLRKNLSLHFIHLTIQEYLAALHVTTLPPKKRRKIISDHCRNTRFHMMWLFAFGLSRNHLSSGCTKKIKGFTDREVCYLISAQEMNNLLLFKYAFESMDEFVTLKVATSVDGFFTKVDGSVVNNSYDYAAVSRIIRYTTTTFCDSMTVNISNGGMTEKLLLEDFACILCQENIPPIKSLNLDGNSISDKGINDMFIKGSKCFNQLQALSLVGNKITNPVRIPLTKLVILSLSENPLGITGILSLQTAIFEENRLSLQTLELANTLTEDADINGALLTSLFDCLIPRTPSLQFIDFSKNMLGVPGACALGEAISLFNSKGCISRKLEINIGETAIGDYAFSAFVECGFKKCLIDCSNVNSPLRLDINLENNTLGRQSLFTLFRLLGNEYYQFRGLDLNCTNVCTEVLPSSIILELGDYLRSATFTNKLTKLSLDSSKFTDDNVILLAEIIIRLKSLVFLSTEKCSITTNDLYPFNDHLRLHITSDTLKSESNLICWNLSFNFIDDCGATLLKERIFVLLPRLAFVNFEGNPQSYFDTVFTKYIQAEDNVSYNF